MGKKDKVPPPGNKKDPYTNFMKKAKWVSALRASTLDIQGHPIQKEGAKIVAYALLKNIFVERLNLTHCRLGDAGITEFAQMLKVNTTIRHISIGVNEITDLGGVMFASAFLVNRTVTHIYAAGNDFGDDTAAAFAFVLKSNFEIKHLDLCWNAVGELGAEALALSFAKNNGVVIEMGQNRMGDDGCKQFCAALKQSGTREMHNLLNVWQNDIACAGGFAIANLMEKNDRLHTVNLSWNSLSASAAAIARAMAVNQGRGVYIPRTEDEIKKEVAAFLEDGFKKQEELKYVKGQETRVILKQIWVQEPGFPACTVVTLMLSQNLIEDDACDELARLIMANGYLRSLDLSWNLITSDGAMKLFDALKTGTALESLNLAFNKISDSAAPAAAHLISTTSSLSALYLQRNEIREQGKTIISDSIPRTSKIRVNYGALDDMIPLVGAFMAPVVYQNAPSSRGAASRAGPSGRRLSNTSAMSWGTETTREATRARKSQSRGSLASAATAEPPLSP
eukprot:GGOE01036909.1.p1 GENE.GGOE01036909.1~~GGOE01036909.1.p1  ORF type:complete len:509 (-),score=165.43 GGOE01036909.1:239-1765(-)